jgi:hypothetical protein
MDVDRLRRRRELLQLKLRRAERARDYRALAPRLCAAGVRRFSRLPAERVQPLLAPFIAWPAQDERFHWPDIAGHARVYWEDAAVRDASFVDALARCFPPGRKLALVFHPLDSALAIDRDGAMAAPAALLGALYDTLWVVSRDPSDRALVELSFLDRETCWATLD